MASVIGIQASGQLTNALKRYFKNENFSISVAEERPFYATLKKDEGFGGDQMPIVVYYGHQQGVSSNFTKAQANISDVAVAKFAVTTVDHYGVSTVSGKSLRITNSDYKSFLRGEMLKTKGILESVMDSLEAYLFRDGYGWLGSYDGASLSGTTITFANPEDAHCFEKNMKVAWAPDTGTTAAANATTVSEVDRIAGTIKIASAASWGSTGGTTYYVFRDGDDYATATAGFKVVRGALSWNPTAKPASAESFFGVDRSVDNRLWGATYDGSGGDTIEEALITAQSYAASIGEGIDTFYLHNNSYRKLKIELGTDEVFNKPALGPSGPTNLSFEGLVISGDKNRKIGIVSANKCPGNRAVGINSKYAKLVSSGPMPGLLDDDGNILLRTYDADAYEVRVGGYPQFVNTRPVTACSVKL